MSTPQGYGVTGTTKDRIIRIFAVYLGNKRFAIHYQTRDKILEVNIGGWVKYLSLRKKREHSV